MNTSNSEEKNVLLAFFINLLVALCWTYLKEWDAQSWFTACTFPLFPFLPWDYLAISTAWLIATLPL